jgi:hypothetical protein
MRRREAAVLLVETACGGAFICGGYLAQGLGGLLMTGAVTVLAFVIAWERSEPDA